MNSGLSDLHRILKDKTRSQIIMQLYEKGSLSYTNLMNLLGIANTGKLNYHLKVLEDLVEKNPDGLYLLTDKGKLAAQLLQEFKDKKSQSQIEAPFAKGMMTLFCVSALFYISIVFVFYLIGTLDFTMFMLNTISAVSAIVLGFVMERARVKRASWSPKRQMLGAKISSIFAGCSRRRNFRLLCGRLNVSCPNSFRCLLWVLPIFVTVNTCCFDLYALGR